MFGRRGSVGRVDLHDRADHHDLPLGMRLRQRLDQRRVEPLVDDAEEAEPRAGDVALRRVGSARSQRLREVRARRRCSGSSARSGGGPASRGTGSARR